MLMNPKQMQQKGDNHKLQALPHVHQRHQQRVERGLCVCMADLRRQQQRGAVPELVAVGPCHALQVDKAVHLIHRGLLRFQHIRGGDEGARVVVGKKERREGQERAEEEDAREDAVHGEVVESVIEEQEARCGGELDGKVHFSRADGRQAEVLHLEVVHGDVEVRQRLPEQEEERGLPHGEAVEGDQQLEALLEDRREARFAVHPEGACLGE